MKEKMSSVVEQNELAEDGTVNETNKSYEEDGCFSLVDGSTVFTVGIHFSKTSKATLDDKLKKLIRQDIQRENF
ncbi:MAG: hypothetical protein Q4B70_04525 [Lachnospiraceae bacterium]|nr:hypothetical protein [Lachnospiraceae bacterium]